MPETICVSNSFLVLEYIKEAPKKKCFWFSFGKKLACLHKNSATFYGLDYDNYIGPISQKNNLNKNWIDFFISRRLEVLLRKIDPSSGIAIKFNPIFNRIADFSNNESPALLHGDLWSGNFISFSDSVCLFDPAVYYGHREVDLAMTYLFGGFDSNFYNGYNEVYPLSAGWKERFDLYNLYPLLVHLILFGDTYSDQILKILNRYA